MFRDNLSLIESKTVATVVVRGRSMKVVLTIAGSDSSGGAGIQADLKTFAAYGVYGVSAVTAVTAQNTKGLSANHTVPPEVIRTQIESSLLDFPIAAVKTGMLSNELSVESVATSIKKHRIPNLVVDPVIMTSTGSPLMSTVAIDLLKRTLLPLACVVTPNRMEAEHLSGIPITSIAHLRDAVRCLYDLGPKTVVITGGHFKENDDQVIDVIYDGKDLIEHRVSRVETLNSHGTGCAFAAAVTAALALGKPVFESTRLAQRFVAGALMHSNHLGNLCSQLNHFWQSSTRISAP